MNVAPALAQAAALGLERLDAQLLLLHALGRDPSQRAWLLAHDTDPIASAVADHFLALCKRRSLGEPVAYLTGRKEFFGLALGVDSRVLVPRPDTETLVEWALELAPQGGSVIDLGTGSGAIALALKQRRQDLQVEAVDISADALSVAQANACALGLDVNMRLACWLEGAGGGHDLIVSNPPYVATGDPHLAALGHEPALALEAGPDGLRDIRTIIAQAPGCLRPAGWLLLEHGWNQSAEVRALLAAAGFAAVTSRTDLAGIERCSGGKWPELG